MNSKNKSALYWVFGLLAGMLVMYLFNNYKIEKKNQDSTSIEISNTKSDSDYGSKFNSKTNPNWNNDRNENQQSSRTSTSNIDNLTEENRVIAYVKEHHELPNYYITKGEARNQGWEASKGNLCDVLPGRAIGGDRFSNREKTLPKGDSYFEADVNYSCGRRNADRIVFTKNGDVYLTKNHYKTFEKQ